MIKEKLKEAGTVSNQLIELEKAVEERHAQFQFALDKENEMLAARDHIIDADILKEAKELAL